MILQSNSKTFKIPYVRSRKKLRMQRAAKRCQIVHAWIVRRWPRKSCSILNKPWTHSNRTIRSNWPSRHKLLRNKSHSWKRPKTSPNCFKASSTPPKKLSLVFNKKCTLKGKPTKRDWFKLQKNSNERQIRPNLQWNLTFKRALKTRRMSWNGGKSRSMGQKGPRRKK